MRLSGKTLLVKDKVWDGFSWGVMKSLLGHDYMRGYCGRKVFDNNNMYFVSLHKTLTDWNNIETNIRDSTTLNSYIIHISRIQIMFKKATLNSKWASRQTMHLLSFDKLQP